MHIGYSPIFQNPGNTLTDAEVYRKELHLAELADPLGFDSIWSVEHHFTDYTMCPDPLQFLSYMTGRCPRLQVGTMVVVLPWHDPVRVAEQISMLDNLCGGLLLLGLGRGLGRIEYEGFRIDMSEGRERFVEYAELVLEGLERGYVEGGKTVQQPRRDLRPFPQRSFRGRTYAAAVAPESMPIMAKLGAGLLIIPQKPWEVVKQDFEVYTRVFHDINGMAPPPPFCGGFYFVDENADRAEELARKYIGRYYHSVMQHYEMTADHFGAAKGYEFYKNVGGYIDRHGTDGAANDFVELMPWGTPEQVLEKLAYIHNVIGMNGMMCSFSYAGMPYDEAERNMRCFTSEVMPELRKWKTEPLAEPVPLQLESAASS